MKLNALELSQEAAAHRAAYAAILNSLLQAPAAKQHFCAYVRITPGYLSCLLREDDRVASPALARRIAAALPIELSEREMLIDHLLLAKEKRLQLERIANQPISLHELQQQLAELRQSHHQADFAADPRAAHRQYRMIWQSGRILFRRLHPRIHGLDLVEICFLLHDTASVFNAHGEALFYAHLAMEIVRGFEPHQGSETERCVQYEMNALRAKAVAYHNLHQPHVAYQLCEQGEKLAAMRQSPDFWSPHLYRDTINTLSGKPRFLLGDVELFARRGLHVCERVNDATSPLLALMLDRSLARAYLRYGAPKKAYRLLQPHLEMLEARQFPHAGPLHYVLVTSTCAEAVRQQGDHQRWQALLRRAVQVAQDAGLNHQLQKLRQQYGTPLQEVLASAHTD